MSLLTEKVAREIAEMYVFSELLKRSVTPYASVAGGSADALLKTDTGVVLDLSTYCSRKGDGTFAVPDFRPDKKRFIVCVEFDDRDIPEGWVFPSLVFHAYSIGPNKKGLRILDLDGGRRKYLGKPLRDYIRGFLNRWELISDYHYYRRFMNSPQGYEDLEDVLLMRLVEEEPETDEEPVPFRASAFGITDALSG